MATQSVPHYKMALKEAVASATAPPMYEKGAEVEGKKTQNRQQQKNIDSNGIAAKYTIKCRLGSKSYVMSAMAMLLN